MSSTELNLKTTPTSHLFQCGRNIFCAYTFSKFNCEHLGKVRPVCVQADNVKEGGFLPIFGCNNFYVSE